MMPLTLADIGTENTIRRVGGNEETRRFLENLGFVTGNLSNLKVPCALNAMQSAGVDTVLSSIGGNVIVNVKDSRVAINEDMARHIMI